MSKETKVAFLKTVLESSYDQIQFQKFIKEFLNEPDMLQAIRRTDVGAEYEKHIEDYAVIAKYEDNEGNKIIVLSVTLHKNHSVENARTLQRNFISKVLEQQNCDAAIVAFYSPEVVYWRLSFVRLDYTFTDKGLALDLTPAKRFSYLVGVGEPSHTAQAQLLPILENDKDNPTIDKVEKAFSVEKVTKEFFELYKDKYLQLKDYLEQDEAFINETEKLGFEVPKFAEQFAKKLLGQLAFLYFIQKKGWLGVRILPENHTLSDSDYQAIYMQNDEPRRKVLEKVFMPLENGQRKISSQALVTLTDYETELFSDCFINTPFHQPWGSGERKFISTIFKNCVKNDKNFFDDYLEPLFYAALNKKRKNHYFNQFNCKIPFLNGGLFEPLEGYHWRDVNFNIPNHLFSNEDEKGRKADGILDIFERFNFTMNEDEPLEKEVAVDPEMLGKIFENLLDVHDRKSKGAFYTPREIVHYMCQESLVNYLVNEVDVPYEDIREFILYGDLIRDMDSRSEAENKETFRIKSGVHNNIVNIDKALANIKVADPAVGSGAFPLGLLSEIVRARNNITEYLVWLDKAGKLGQNIGEQKIRKSRLPYELKRATIKNSIFAVDIEPSAVDIAKLRLWLSVVVDQEINEENQDPKPLPNLDMNILVGNSLVDEYEGIRLFDEGILYRSNSKYKKPQEINFSQQLNLLIDDSEKMLEDMFKLQDLYFDEEDEERKRELKVKIDNIRDQLIEYKLGHDGNKVGLQKYEELKKKKQKPYFLWYLEFAKVFQDKGGFDIVIGNPPYVSANNMSLEERRVLTNLNQYKSLKGKWDLYIAFVEKSLALLASKGVFSFIIPYGFLNQPFAESLRKIILDNYELRIIVDLHNNKIFENATVPSCIPFIKKGKNESSDYFVDIIDFMNNSFNTKYSINIQRYHNTNQHMFRTENLEQTSELLNRIKDAGEELEVDFYVSTGAEIHGKEKRDKDGTKISGRSKFDVLFTEYREGLKPYIEGASIKKSQIGRYSSPDITTWLDYSEPEKMRSPKFRELFESEKIIIRGSSGLLGILGIYDNANIYTSHKCTLIIKKSNLPESNNQYKDEVKTDLKYLLAVLNSKLMNFYYQSVFGGFIDVYPNNLKKLPIAKSDAKLSSEVISLVDEVIRKKSNKEAAEEIEQKIDALIYEIYGLTSDEIRLVEQK